MGFPEADARTFKNIWVCLDCHVTNRCGPGKKPFKCRKCGCKFLRLKRKRKKIAK